MMDSSILTAACPTLHYPDNHHSEAMMSYIPNFFNQPDEVMMQQHVPQWHLFDGENLWSRVSNNYNLFHY